MTSPGSVSKTPLKTIGARDILKLDYQKSGHLRKEGLLERSLLGKLVGVTWRQVFVVLRDGCCYVFDNDQSTQPKTAFSFENYSRLECFEKPPDLDYCFKLLPRVNYVEMKEHCFAASDDNSRKEWLIAFYKAFHVANDLPEPLDVGNDDWTKDIFKRIGGNRYDYIDEEREGNLSNTKRRYSDMPTKSKSQVFKTRSLPPVPKEVSYDEPELDSESELPDESYDDCAVGTKPQPSKIKPKRASLPALPRPPKETNPTESRGQYINMDYKKPKVDDLPLFEGNSAEAKAAISSEAVGTFIIRKSSQSEGRTPYVLVVSGPEEEVQFRIYKKEQGGIYIAEENIFQSLSELVAYYRKNELSAKTKLKLAKHYGHMEL